MRKFARDVFTLRKTINSKALGNKVQLSIYNIRGDEAESVHDAIFLLVGDAFFDYTVATVDYYTRSLRAPPLAVIGIDVKDRKTSFNPITQSDNSVPPFKRCLRDARAYSYKEIY
jgi:enterochelin esterase-like enzyme